MFTGLIEELGEIKKVDSTGTNYDIEVVCAEVLEDMKLGDSIAVDGCCQTVTKINGGSFCVTAIDETLKLTNFKSYKKNFDEGKATKVNLERCLRLQDRLGGHIVQGHVDTIATLEEVKDADGSYELSFKIKQPENIEKPINRYIIHKGSITLNGISLTVAEIEGDLVKVCIIPKTWEVTNLSKLNIGDEINVEVDLLAKYIEKIHA